MTSITVIPGLVPMGANISSDGLSSASSPGLSRGPIAALLETLVPGTSPGMTVFAAISHYVSAYGDKPRVGGIYGRNGIGTNRAFALKAFALGRDPRTAPPGTPHPPERMAA